MRERQADLIPTLLPARAADTICTRKYPMGSTMGWGRRMSVRHACLDDIGKR